MSNLKKKKAPEENTVGDEESQDFERTCSKICVPSEDVQPDIAESLNQYAGSQLVSISNALDEDEVEEGHENAEDVVEGENVEDEVEETTQKPEEAQEETQEETQKPSMLQRMKDGLNNGLSAMKGFMP